MLNLLAADIIERFYAFMWPMLRISALMLTAPILAQNAFNLRLRILMAMVLTWLIYPLHKWPFMDPTSARGLLEVFNQIAIGSIMGLVLQIVVAAVVVGGQSISSSMGLSMANMIDPTLGNVPVVSQFLLILASLVFVGFGGHAILLGLVSDSFHSLPIGTSILQQAVLGKVLRWSSMMFLGALLMALPVMVFLLFINVGLGIVTRAAPSLNIFSVGFPAMVLAGFMILILSMDAIGGRIDWLWTQGFGVLRELMGTPNV
jgi:flagellar biosynthetic protein FliR